MTGHREIVIALSLTAGLAGAASAQAPGHAHAPAGGAGFVPGVDQPTPGSVAAAERRYREEPRRDQVQDEVAPPSAISSDVQIIAPARR